MSAARSKDTYLAAKYRRIAARHGPIKAVVAVEHAMLIAIWHMITDGVFYSQPGSDFYTRRNPDKTKTARPATAPTDGLRGHPQPPAGSRVVRNLRVRGYFCGDTDGALGGTRTPNLLIRREVDATDNGRLPATIASAQSPPAPKNPSSCRNLAPRMMPRR